MSRQPPSRGRKRQQPMPASNPGPGLNPGSGAARLTPINTSTNQSAASAAVPRGTKFINDLVKAVIYVEHDWNAEWIRSCAEEMFREGKVVDAGSLMQEYNARYLSSPSGHRNHSKNQSRVGSLPPSNSTGSLSSSESSESEDEVDCPEFYLSSTSSNNHRRNNVPSENENHRECRTHPSSSSQLDVSDSSISVGEDQTDGATLSCIADTSERSKHSKYHNSSSFVSEVQQARSSSVRPNERLERVSAHATKAKNAQLNLDHPQAASLATGRPTRGESTEKITTRKSSGVSLDSINKDGSVGTSDIEIDSERETLTLQDEWPIKFDDSLEMKESESLKSRNTEDKMAVAKMSPEHLHLRILLELITKEHELLEMQRKCIECKERPRDVTFLPCGHFTVCTICSEPRFVCQLCNRAILGTVTTYLS